MKIFEPKPEAKVEEKGTDKSIGRGNSSSRVYQVQIRVQDNWPSFQFGPMIVDQVWRDIHLTPAQMPVGVPTSQHDMENIDWGVPFPQAEAHRWIVICAAESHHKSSAIETRIIQRRIERSWSAHEVGVVTKPPAWSDPHNIWGAKKEPEVESAAK